MPWMKKIRPRQICFTRSLRDSNSCRGWSVPRTGGRQRQRRDDATRRVRTMTPRYVSFASEHSDPGPLAGAAAEWTATGIEDALGFARELGRVAPAPGCGSTRDLWEALATIASFDLGVAR